MEKSGEDTVGKEAPEGGDAHATCWSCVSPTQERQFKLQNKNKLVKYKF